ncbi:MAG: flagellar biosynthesis protein FlhA [Victivallales bacterium]|nr:flagellar biosynthesis protein FlhA [Victivallales bacterium]
MATTKDMTKRKTPFNADIVFAFFVGAVLFILLFPLPQMVLSLLLVVNISISLMMLMMIFYLKSPLEISSFPTILLVLTLFRLALNVASTKLILLQGNAGTVIAAFGEFVVGNNYIVGAIVFVILVVINFFVIVKGSSRIAEVSARFSLDAMPGKQMSIDSDLNAGLIDEAEARRRRAELSEASEFYGAMDGASKFVTGDAIAGIIITVINILGGIAIGVFQRGESVTEAMQMYTILTIGDGLVSQIPGLLISVSAGMLVAKTNSNSGGTGSHLASQMFRRHQPMFVCAVMLMVLAILPGFPFLPFMTMAIAGIIGGVIIKRRNEGEEEEMALAGAGGRQQLAGGKNNPALPGETPEEAARRKHDAEVNTLPKIHPMTLEVGFNLISMVDPHRNGDLVNRVRMIRGQIKEELGFLIPPISIQDNMDLASNEYRITVRGLERARGVAYPNNHLAINPGNLTVRLDGIKGKDPAFGFDAVWISDGKVDSAESQGFTVVDAASVIATHVTKIIKDYASDLISRQDVSNMLEKIKENNPAVVEELVPNLLPVGVVHRVLQHLLEEKVPVHDLPAILETLSDYAAQTKDPVILCEFARQALKGHIVGSHIGDDMTLYAITIDPVIEEEIQSAISQGNGGGIMSLSPERAVAITDAIVEAHNAAADMVDDDVVVLTSPLIRLHIFRMLDRKLTDIPVLSYSEVTDDVPLKILGLVKFNNEGKFAA